MFLSQNKILSKQVLEFKFIEYESVKNFRLSVCFSTMTQDLYLKSETTKRYEIPLTHLDYEYIRNCSDVKELEKIVKILR